jgi:hypothetical protein
MKRVAQATQTNPFEALGLNYNNLDPKLLDHSLKLTRCNIQI